ncbi:MAG: hypothetical protein BroJett040_22460 [Oligoflexia bacterium]|nr:MAG: hypothetical protein BroJett040_22460 [Oligoflexia bacterium]
MTKKTLGRALILIGALLLTSLFAWEAFSQEIQIIDVRRNIPMSDDEPVYKDFIINAGTNQGLKDNQVVTAKRKLGIKDATGTQSYGDIMVPVGQLKIIFISDRIAVAREYKNISRDEEPMLEQTGMMSGDKIDTAGSFIETRKWSPPKKAVILPPVQAQPALVASPPGAPLAAPATTPTPTPPPVAVVPQTPAPVVSPAPAVATKPTEAEKVLAKEASSEQKALE